MGPQATLSTRAAAALRAFLTPRVRPVDLARQAGVTPQYVNSVLTGKRPPSARIVKAAGELGLPVEVIFGKGASKGEKKRRGPST